MTADTQTLLDQAAAHLDAAAAHARADDTARGQVVAGLIQLTRAGIAPGSFDLGSFEDPDLTPGPDTVVGRLRAALTALDGIDPLDGPADLLAWSAHLAELLQTLDPDGARRP